MDLAVKGQVEVVVHRQGRVKSRSVMTNAVNARVTNGLMDRVRGGDYPDNGVPNSMLVVTSGNNTETVTAFSHRGYATAQDGSSVTATFSVSDLQLGGGSGSTVSNVALYGTRVPLDGILLAMTGSISPNPSFIEGDLVDINYRLIFTLVNADMDAAWVARLVDSMVGQDGGSSGYVAKNNLPCAVNYARAANGVTEVASTTIAMIGAGNYSEAYTGSALGIHYEDVGTGTRPNRVLIYTEDDNGNFIDVGASDLSYANQPLWSTGDNLKVPFSFNITPDS